MGSIHFTFKHIRDSHTCKTCHIMFKNLEAHNIHYKSEWHRCNLYRKVHVLPPITLEAFEKESTVYSTGSVYKHKEKKNHKCIICRKKFGNEKQYYNHLVSKNHKKKEEKNKAKVDKDQNKDLTNTENKIEIDTDSNVKSLDLEKWLDDLENPIDRNDCSFCDHHSRSTTRRRVESVEELMYMLDEAFSTPLYDIPLFYDYLLRYPDAKDADPNMEPPKTDLNVEGYELKLPFVIATGALMHRCKQNLSLGSSLTDSVTRTRKDEEKLLKLLMQYRAPDDTNMQMEASRRKGVPYSQKVQTKYSKQLQFKQNKLQKHFRKQTNFF